MMVPLEEVVDSMGIQNWPIRSRETTEILHDEVVPASFPDWVEEAKRTY